jgi:hypothetical protein
VYGCQRFRPQSVLMSLMPERMEQVSSCIR